jgi:hypothetical protein
VNEKAAAVLACSALFGSTKRIVLNEAEDYTDYVGGVLQGIPGAIRQRLPGFLALNTVDSQVRRVFENCFTSFRHLFRY